MRLLKGEVSLLTRAKRRVSGRSGLAISPKSSPWIKLGSDAKVCLQQGKKRVELDSSGVVRKSDLKPRNTAAS